MLRCVDIAVCKYRNFYSRFDRRHCVMLRNPKIHVRTRAAVYAKSLNAAVFCDYRDPHAVLVVAIPASARLQRHRRRDGAHHGVQDACNQRFVLHQGGTRETIANFLGGTSHVDVDDFGAGVHIPERRVSHHLRIEARDLHHTRTRLAGVVHAQPRLLGVPQPRVGGEHFGGGEARAEAAAQESKRSVGDAGHGRENDVGRQDIRADFDRHHFACVAASPAHTRFLSAPRRHTSISNPSASLPGSKISRTASARSPGASMCTVALPIYSDGSNSRSATRVPKRLASVTRSSGYGCKCAAVFMMLARTRSVPLAPGSPVTPHCRN